MKTYHVDFVASTRGEQVTFRVKANSSGHAEVVAKDYLANAKEWICVGIDLSKDVS